MKDIDEYIKEVCDKWGSCPLCGQYGGLEVQKGIINRGISCKICSAEWLAIPTVNGIKGLKLTKMGRSNIAAQYNLQTHPLEWWAGLRERLRKAEEKGNWCPFCGSEVGFQCRLANRADLEKLPPGIFHPSSIMFCPACSAELMPCFAKNGEAKGFTLLKPDLAGRATKYVSKTMLLEEWLELNLPGVKVKESKEELIPQEKKVEELKEEQIAKLDKRLINGEISEDTYKQILERIKNNSAKERSQNNIKGKSEFTQTKSTELNLLNIDNDPTLKMMNTDLFDIDPALKMMNTGVKLVAGGAVLYIIGFFLFLFFILILILF